MKKDKKGKVRNLKFKYTKHTPEGQNFLDAKINLNPVLIKNVEQKMPRYQLKRFANACDVNACAKDYPFTRDLSTEEILNIDLDAECLNKLELPQPAGDIALLMETTKTRINKSVDIEKQVDLPLCSPWLSKKRPLSAKESENGSYKGKIYTSISVRHSVKDDFVVVQETDSRFGYMPPIFDAKATVAFPPICEGEMWSVGWIQACKKADRKLHYDQNVTLVVQKCTNILK